MMTEHNSAPQSHRLVEGQIRQLNQDGDGILNLPGLTVAVARTACGDRIKAQVPALAQRFCHGDLVKVVQGGPGRRDPGCAAFSGGCGGCQWLHLSYQEQLAQKHRLCTEALSGLGQEFSVQPVSAMDQPQGFRNKLSLQNQGGKLFFMQEFGGRHSAPSTCKVQTVALEMLWQKLKGLPVPPEVLQIHARSGDSASIGIHMFVRRLGPGLGKFAQTLKALSPSIAGIGASAGETYQVLAGKEWIEHRCAGIKYRIPLNGFFQTNYSQARELLKASVAALDPAPHDQILDLYCGCGYFSLPLAAQAKKVFGIENNPASIEAARENARLNAVANAEFLAADTARGLQGLKAGEWQKVLLDPPRAGCDQAALEGLLRLAPQRIAYVSCSLESLARDLAWLIKHGYGVEAVRPFDLFPHSFHVETLATLVKKP